MSLGGFCFHKHFSEVDLIMSSRRVMVMGSCGLGFLSRHLTSFLHLRALRVSDDGVLYWADASKDSVHLPICASHRLWVSLLTGSQMGRPSQEV